MRISAIQFCIVMLLIMCSSILTMQAQKSQSALLTIGDPAPSLQVNKWLKGSPVETFKKGKVYVVELWATWCGPCIKSMPHLSVLSRDYKDKVTIIGVDVYENETTTLSEIKSFVDSMGERMDYAVATDNNNSVVNNWLIAESIENGLYGIPRAYVINKEGKLAWSGLPKDLDTVLQRVVDDTWTINQETERQTEDRRLKKLENAINDTLNGYTGDRRLNPSDMGQPDSTLFKIDQALAREPKLAYSSFIVFHTFSALLKTNPDKAFEYVRSVLNDPSYSNKDYLNLALLIDSFSDALFFPAKIYRLGAELEKARISSYGKDINIPNAYHKMADFYYQAKDKHKAKRAGRKAIRALKKEKTFSKTDMSLYEAQLKQYRKM